MGAFESLRPANVQMDKAPHGKATESHGGAALAGALARHTSSGEAGHGPEASHGAHGALARALWGSENRGELWKDMGPK